MSYQSIILLTFLFCLMSSMAEEDYYNILGVKKDAKEREIKKAYRHMSLKYHPDKCQTEECKVKFSEVQEAYDVLTDENLRRVYDLKGKKGVEDYKKNKESQGNNPFGDFFGQRQRTNDKQVTVKVQLADFYNGKEYTIEVPRKELCPHCHGSGAETPDHVHTCPKCNGQGFTIVKHEFAPGFVQQMQQPCPKCGGKGTIIDKKCHVCHGKHLIDGKVQLDVTIERGMKDGEQLVFEHKGDQDPDLDSGHIIVILKQESHPTFTREEDNLKTSINITLKEALLGWKRTIKHLDGHTVEIGNQDVTRPGQVFTIKEEGMPKHNFPSEKGDLLVTVKVKFPKSLTKAQKESLATILK